MKATVAPEVRFFKYVQTTDSCWLWIGAKDKFGYGTFYAGAPQKRSIPAHKYSWILHKGPIPNDLFVCHNCPTGDNPACVSPDHLFLGTCGDNVRDAVQKGRMGRLVESQVIAIRQLYRDGRTQDSLAEEFSVCQEHISDIVRGKCWKHLLPKSDQLTML
jgi:hypothetical protein